MSDRSSAVWKAFYAHRDDAMDWATLADAVADAIETGLTWAPSFRCTVNQLHTGKICRMNQGHIGSHRSADGGEW